MIMQEILVALTVLMSSFMVLMILTRYSKSRFWCDKFGWHHSRHVETSGFDGCSETGLCKRCGEKVLMDSQGNWF
jgi:hypothetical protein